jgi:hypothetical protein
VGLCAEKHPQLCVSSIRTARRSPISTSPRERALCNTGRDAHARGSLSLSTAISRFPEVLWLLSNASCLRGDLNARDSVTR